MIHILYTLALGQVLQIKYFNLQGVSMLLLHSEWLGFTYIQVVEPYKQVSTTTREHSECLCYIPPYAGYLNQPPL